jgi:hypothetical protein
MANSPRETSNVQMRDDKTEVKSLVLPKTKKDATLTCLSSVLEAEGTPGSSLLCLCRRAPLCRYTVHGHVTGCNWISGLTITTIEQSPRLCQGILAAPLQWQRPAGERLSCHRRAQTPVRRPFLGPLASRTPFLGLCFACLE